MKRRGYRNDLPPAAGSQALSRGLAGYFECERSLLDGAPADDVSRMDDVSDDDELLFMEEVSDRAAGWLGRRPWTPP
jgi:hypothetical protein